VLGVSGARADHKGVVRGGMRNGRVGGRSVLVGWLAGVSEGFAVTGLAEVLLREGKFPVLGFRNEAVTRRGDNGLVGGLVVVDGEASGEVRRVESGPVGGLLVESVALGDGLGGVVVEGGVGTVVRAPNRPVRGLA
jgi:hypothetical protein